MNRIWKTLSLAIALLLVLAMPALATQEGNIDNTVNGNNQCAHVNTFEVIAQYQSCEATGLRETICSDCNEVIAAAVIPANGHDMKLAEEQAAKCTVDGWQVYKCTNPGCNYTETIAIPAPGHDYHFVRIVEEAKCEQIGYQLEKCLMCEEYRTVDIPALVHNWALTAHLDAECEADGYDQYTCTLCALVKTDGIAALGHDWTAWAIDEKPLCEQAGMRSRYCTRACCYESNLLKVTKQTEIIPAHGHMISRGTTTPATCTTAGSVTGTCDYCSKSVTLAGDPAIGHNMGAWTVTTAVTCTTDGVESSTCANGCGLVETRAIAAIGHSFGEWTVTKAATATEAGEEARTCAACGVAESRAIPATGVVEESKPSNGSSSGSSSSDSSSGGNYASSSSSGVEIPATGDVSMTWAYLMMAASAAVLVAMKRRAMN